MPDLGLLSTLSARPGKPSRLIPVSTQTFFTGLVTQRSPFGSLDNRYNRRFLGGRPDQLIGGLNMEISNYGTMIRRPGFTLFSTQTLPPPILTFYSFHNLQGVIQVMADTATGVYTIAPLSSQLILTKGMGAGQTSFLGVGNTLYMGDGIDLQAWDGVSASTRNWGIGITSAANAVTNAAGNGANDGSPATAWVNPNNITSNSLYANGNLTTGTGVTSDTQELLATQFGFAEPLTSTISGVQVSFRAYATNTSTKPQLFIQLVKGGVRTGNYKVINLTSVATVYTLGSPTDLWGTTLSPSDVNQTNWGFAIQGNQNIAGICQINVNGGFATVYGTGGPTVTPTGSGSLSTVNGGWQYEYSYGNSGSGQISSPTPPSSSTGNFGGAISASTVGSAGINYVANDTGLIFAGNGTAAYKVLTVDTNGAVLTYSITNAGLGYSVANFVGTFTSGAQPGKGTGFSINITAVTGVSYVGVSLTASMDPQVNQIWVWRTKDGGGVYFSLPGNPFPNTTQVIHDSSPDSALNTLIIAPALLANNPPPVGLKNLVYHEGRIFGSSGNFLYYSGGPDTLTGNGNESFPANNYFQLPSQINRLVPIAVGLLIFTTDDIFILNGPTPSTFYITPYLPGFGLLSFNELDLQGSNIYFYTADKRFMNLSSSGIDEVGFQIGDQLQQNFNPSIGYVALLSQGTSDQCVFVADGFSSWYRLNPNQVPEGGPAWSPIASPAFGLQAVVTCETSPGNHQLLVSNSLGQVLYRDQNNFSDNGTLYTANFIVGSIVLAQPGQLSNVQSITEELQRVGTFPTISVILDEISGTFETLTHLEPDPPNLVPSTSLYSQRAYLSSAQDAYVCRHIQIKTSFIAEAQRNELLTLSIYAGLDEKE